MTLAPDQALVGEFVMAAHHDLARVRALLEAEPGLLDVPFKRFGETAIQAASHVGRDDIIGYLLERGAPCDIFTAAALGDTSRVAGWLNGDPELANAKGVHGISLMFHAALSSNVDTATLIADRGGLVPDEALHGAVGQGRLEMTRWLLQRVGNPDAPNYASKTPLTVALELGQGDIVTLLPSHGAREGSSQTPA